MSQGEDNKPKTPQLLVERPLLHLEEAIHLAQGGHLVLHQGDDRSRHGSDPGHHAEEGRQAPAAGDR